MRDGQEADAAAERIQPARRSLMRPAGPERAAEILHTFLRVGVQGFTFNNPNLTTPELLDVAGRVKRLLG